MADRRGNEGRFMRALCAVLLLAVLSTGVTGCAVFGKKEGSSDRHGPFAGLFKKKETTTNPPPPKFPDPLTSPAGPATPAVPPATAQAANTPEALLSGQVVDAYMRPVTHSYVQLVRVDSPQEEAKPIDIEAGDSYFIIPRLKVGGQYRLIARSKQGDKMLAGITIRQAPDTKVVIQVSEDFATSSIPPLPEPGDKKDTKPAASSGLDNRPPARAIWMPTPSGSPALTGQGGAEVELPAKLTVPTPSAAPDTLAPGVAGSPSTGWPPTLQIGPKKSTTPPANNSAPQPPALPGNIQGQLPPLVPSCVVLGSKVQILALKDVNDQTWSLQKDRKGKVVLLDFWMPKCAPCQRTMPTLAQVQYKYGPQGLEVVGVYIDSGRFHDQAQRAKLTSSQLQANYRQLVGQDDMTHLREQFHVQNFPTMILLDAQGHIRWRHEGEIDQAELERVLQKHLANQPF